METGKLIELLPQIRSLRRLLHLYPELSGRETKTYEIIKKFILHYKPNEVIEFFNNNAIAFTYIGEKKGNHIIFRADIDAIPLQEQTNLSYSSRNNCVSHACGHDGHISILAGLAGLINNNPLERGKVTLLFQPSEENGKGALSIINSKEFSAINPDYIFALHNIPGVERENIIVRDGVFALASKGIKIHLQGKSCHAAYPELGISPIESLSRIILAVSSLIKNNEYEGYFALLTIVHTSCGENSYGTSPGEAILMLTIRSYKNETLVKLSNAIENIIKINLLDSSLEYQIIDEDVFPSTINHKEAVKIIKEAATLSSLKIIEKEAPFRWSEDFGVYIEKFCGAMFGIGCGEDCLPLHNNRYNFPDQIIESAITIFDNIIKITI